MLLSEALRILHSLFFIGPEIQHDIAFQRNFQLFQNLHGVQPDDGAALVVAGATTDQKPIDFRRLPRVIGPAFSGLHHVQVGKNPDQPSAGLVISIAGRPIPILMVVYIEPPLFCHFQGQGQHLCTLHAKGLPILTLAADAGNPDQFFQILHNIISMRVDILVDPTDQLLSIHTFLISLISISAADICCARRFLCTLSYTNWRQLSRSSFSPHPSVKDRGLLKHAGPDP